MDSWLRLFLLTIITFLLAPKNLPDESKPKKFAHCSVPIWLRRSRDQLGNGEGDVMNLSGNRMFKTFMCMFLRLKILSSLPGCFL